jgi:hypothetical protein
VRTTYNPRPVLRGCRLGLYLYGTALLLIRLYTAYIDIYSYIFGNMQYAVKVMGGMLADSSPTKACERVPVRNFSTI